MKRQMKMSSEATAGPVLQKPHPSLSTLVENRSSFGGKTCSMGRCLAIRKAFWNALEGGFEIFFFPSFLWWIWQTLCVTVVFWDSKILTKNNVIHEAMLIFKIDVGWLERIRENTDKESKISSFDCLLAAWKQGSSPSPLSRSVPYQIPACQLPSAQRCGESGSGRTGYLKRRRHSSRDTECSHGFFTWLREQIQKGCVGKLCRSHQCLWCYPIVCLALQAIKHSCWRLLISNVAFHNLPTPSAHNLSSTGHSSLQSISSGLHSPGDANEN